MCRALYIASDQPIAGPVWDESRPAFHVAELSADEQGVRARFDKRFVAFLGAHTQCSCGFTYGLGRSTGLGDTTLQEDDQSGRLSVRALRRFLEARLETVDEVDLFSCWSGDEHLPAAHEAIVGLDFFDGETFELRERALYHVRCR